jgi:hypothetical protein
LLIIDYQPVQVSSVLSMDRHLLIENIVRVAKTARAYGLPIAVSTVNVKTGVNKPMIPELQNVLDGIEPLDRTAINAWEDGEFVAAVRATGRKKLITTALWTEVCLSPSPRSMRCARAMKFAPSSTRSAAPPSKRTWPGWSACTKPALTRRAGRSSSASCSAIGTGRKPRSRL